MKNIIVINGRGGCGKDTVISMMIDLRKAMNISAIDPIKEIASKYGYKDSEKTDKARKFLSDLKRVFVEWNDLPVKYLIEKIAEFDNDEDSDIIFVHIREPEEIDKFKQAVVEYAESTAEYPGDENRFKVTTLLVKRNDTDNKVYGNSSDDEVENYKYDFTYINDKSVYNASSDFHVFVEENILCPEG